MKTSFLLSISVNLFISFHLHSQSNPNVRLTPYHDITLIAVSAYQSCTDSSYMVELHQGQPLHTTKLHTLDSTNHSGVSRASNYRIIQDAISAYTMEQGFYIKSLIHEPLASNCGVKQTYVLMRKNPSIEQTQWSVSIHDQD